MKAGDPESELDRLLLLGDSTDDLSLSAPERSTEKGLSTE